MKQFVQRLSTDRAFAAEFREFMCGKDGKIREYTKEFGQLLNRRVMNSVREFAASRGIPLTDDEEVARTLAAVNRQLCRELDETVLRAFAALEAEAQGSSRP